ncbi:MAG: glycoside hydrolase family 18 protein, partial [Pirellulales bacterium]
QAIGGAATLAAAAPHALAASGTKFCIVGYLPWYRLKSWSSAQAGPLTELVYFGVQPTTDGELPADPVDRATLESLRRLKHATGCRLNLCVGGGNRSAGFAALVEQGRRRRAFVRGLRDVCQRAGFDGVDYDWEYPSGDAQLAEYHRLIDETRKSLGDRRQITVAQSPWRDFGRAIYEAVDRVHVMSYNHKHPHAQLGDARADIDRMLKFGCPRSKLVLGVPFYGRNQRGHSRTYAELTRSDSFETDRDLIDGFAFNSRQTLRQKVRYARDEQLAGIMIWEIGQDATEPNVSLLGAIAAELEA